MPSSHRAAPARSETMRRLIPPVAAVTSVVVVVLLLIVINSRPERSGAGPAVVSPAPGPPSTTTTAPTSSTAPVTAATTAGAPPVEEPPATASPAAQKPAVTVLNNSRRAGLASRVAAQLSRGGWPIAQVGNFRGRIRQTTIYYAAGQIDAARSLAHQFRQIARIAGRFAGLPGHGLTLVVTRDWS
jgi:hypothetical protein